MDEEEARFPVLRFLYEVCKIPTPTLLSYKVPDGNACCARIQSP